MTSKQKTTSEAIAEVENEKKEKLSILRNPNLLMEINNELDKAIVGEEEARLTIFLVANMRNVANLNKATDNLLVNATSGTGKDHVTEAIFDLIHFNEKEELVKATPKVLSYTRNRKHDPLATWQKTAMRLEDAGNNLLNDESFKVFLSANPNKINYGKAFIKGKVEEIAIHGKPSIILTVANPSHNDEQLRRLPICFLDEGIDQTKEILIRQGKQARDGYCIQPDKKLKEALLLLERVNVKIPYADKLVKIFRPEHVIVRTVQNRFFDYIKSSASLYQYQRQRDEDGFIIAERQDFEIACMMLRKTTSNIFMIPLSKTRQKIYDVFQKNLIIDATQDDLQKLEPIQELAISERWLRHNCDWLVSKKLLHRTQTKEEHSAKPVYQYSFKPIDAFDIPSWEELIKKCSNANSNKNMSNRGSNHAITTNTTNSTNSSNTQYKASPLRILNSKPKKSVKKGGKSK